VTAPQDPAPPATRPHQSAREPMVSRLRTVMGAALRRERQAQGRTLREVATAAGVSLTYLSEVERGRKEASSEVLEAVCAALELVLAELLFEVAEELLRLDVRAALPRVGFVPARPAPRAVQPVRPARPASPWPAAQLPPAVGEPIATAPSTPVAGPGPDDAPAPLARVIDLRAFAGRRSA
jgi:transcriptional regulator with XRE-family HTH domain